MKVDRNQNKSVYAAVIVELLFAAIIPLSIMGFFFEDIYGKKLNKSFLLSIDWAICTVILYGLSVSKVLIRFDEKRDRNVIALFVLIILFFIGISIANISSISKPDLNKIEIGAYYLMPAIITMYINLILSCIVFCTVAGWAESKLGNGKRS